MRGAIIRCAIMALAALTAACAGTSRVGDELTATSLTQSKKAVALIKLGAADPMCTMLHAGIGVREGENLPLACNPPGGSPPPGRSPGKKNKGSIGA